MPRTELYKRRVPLEVQGVVVDGIKLTSAVYVPLKGGMTRAKAMAWSEELIARARSRASYRLTDADAWELATAICDAHDNLVANPPEGGFCLHDQLSLFIPGRGPDARGWLRKMGRSDSFEDQARIAQWVERVYAQRFRLKIFEGLVSADDPEALKGWARADRARRAPSAAMQSIRNLTRQTPLHSEVVADYWKAKPRPANYRRALEQFREQCGDLEVSQYTPDHCWTFRNWLSDTLDEKKGQKLSGQTKNNKLSAISSVFSFAIEQRYRNDNPMRDVKPYSKNENRKKKRRLYTAEELSALFVKGKREEEWQYWIPLLGLYAGLRIRETIQLRPENILEQFGVWHLIIQPGRGQIVKGNKARVVPIHKELLRLGFLDLHSRAQKEGREWLFKDVPLVKAKGSKFNAPELDGMLVPSQNAATQWFGRYSDGCGVTDPNVDFHALRGAFVTYGSQQGADLSLRMELAGHSKGSGVHHSYIYAGASLKALKAEIDKIEYPVRIPKQRQVSTGSLMPFPISRRL